MKAIVKILVVLVVLGLPVLFWNDIRGALSPAEKLVENDTPKKKKKKGKEEASLPPSTDIKVLQRWELPEVLTEVSGIEYLGDTRFACIQDEQGTIFVYNTASGRIEKQVPFAGAGDFEGIAVHGTTAWVVQSDGRLYEVQDFLGAKPAVKSYPTELTADHDVEGLTYDRKENRLLLAIKGKEPGSSEYKGIYAFDPGAKKFSTEPVLKINLADPVFSGLKEKKPTRLMQPSEIEIHPQTGDIYVSEGASPKLLVMGADGTKKRLYTLDAADFPQSEGLAFTPGGELFISNEGKGGKGTIVKVAIENGAAE
jgi:uncharacterized protein YjiK